MLGKMSAFTTLGKKEALHIFIINRQNRTLPISSKEVSLTAIRL